MMAPWENLSDATPSPALNLSPPTTSSLEPNATELEQLMDQLSLYYTPLIVVLGVAGNIASMLVLFLTKLRGQSSSFYLSALAASDTAFLLTQLVPWLDEVRWLQYSLFAQPVACQLTQYLANCSGLTSAWFVVAFTVERFVAVVHGLRYESLLSGGRMKLLLLFPWCFMALCWGLLAWFAQGIMLEQFGTAPLRCLFLEVMSPPLKLASSSTIFALCVMVIVLNVFISRVAARHQRNIDRQRLVVGQNTEENVSAYWGVLKVIIIYMVFQVRWTNGVIHIVFQ